MDGRTDDAEAMSMCSDNRIIGPPFQLRNFVTTYIAGILFGLVGKY